MAVDQLGVEARSWALLSEGETTDRLQHEAIERLGHTACVWTVARTHLVYREWLHRCSVDGHLGNGFTKPGITSGKDLR